MLGLRQFAKILVISQICLTVIQLSFLSTEYNSQFVFIQLPDGSGYTEDTSTVDDSSRDKSTSIHTDDDNQSVIAIGMAVTMKNIRAFRWTDVRSSKMPFLNSFLVSFCRTASPGYHYRIYLAYDDVDAQFSSEQFRSRLSDVFYRYVYTGESSCTSASSYQLKFVRCEYTGKPVWSQNDAMVAAYVDGADYFYRVNDDTSLQTPRWTEAFIHALRQYDPPNVGVVGPQHSGGNEYILTYDFVHRTHIEIFGFYYPRFYQTWYADDWMTDVYQPGRTVKLYTVRVDHTRSLGQRYELSELRPASILNAQSDVVKEMLLRYLRRKSAPSLVPNPRKVISIVIWNKTPASLWGAIRNAQLRHHFYPDWTLRVYMYTEGLSSRRDKDKNKTALFDVTTVVRNLKHLQANVLFITESSLPPNLPPSSANLLALVDPNVTWALFRQPEMRFSEREALAVADWLSGKHGAKSAHCMRDHPRHAQMSLVPNLWAANLTAIRKKYRTDLLSLLLPKCIAKYQIVSEKDYAKMETCIYDYLSRMLSNDILCHDSVSCRRWQNSVPFPQDGDKHQFVGQLHSSFAPIKTDEYAKFRPHPECGAKS